MKQLEARLAVSQTIRRSQAGRVRGVRIATWLVISTLLVLGVVLQPLVAAVSPTLAALLPQAKIALAAPPQQAGTATIGNFVWNDLDKDGIQDAGEPGIVGVNMALYTPAGALVQSTASGAGGAYAFNNVAAGTYRVSVEPSNFAIGNLVGFSLSPTGVGTPSTDSNGVLVTGASIYTTTIGAGVTDNTIDFGFYAAGKSTIGNYVWYDANADGDHQGAESEFAAGINGVVLNLYKDDGDATFEPGADDVLYAVTTTGDDPNTAGAQTGWYQFDVAGSSTYWVQVIASNFAPGGPLANHQFTNDGTPYQNANPQIVVLNAAIDTDNTIDFGYAVISDLSVTKSDNPDPVTPGRVLTYTINYANAGPSIATNVRLTDTLPAGVTYGGVVSEVPAISGPTVSGQTLVWVTPTLAVNASGTIVFTVTVNSGVSGVITNTVRISSSAYDPTPGNNRDDEPTNVVNPGIAIAKTPDLQQVVSGGTVTFTIRVTNTGDVTLNPVAVSDPLAPACNRANVGPLTAGQSTSYTCSVSNVTADFTNVATATGTPPSGPPVTDDDDAVVDVIRPSIAIAKTPDLQQVVSGGTVTFTIRVTNTGDVTLNPVAVSDPLAPACNRANVGPLTAGQSTSYTCSVSNVTVDFTNVATATGTPPVGPPVTDDDDAVVDVIRPSIAIAKTPDLQQVVSGGTVTFTIRVTNTGDVTLNPVAVSDPLAPACNRANVGPLTAGQSTSYTCSLTNVTTDFTNVATATGTPPSGPPVTDDDNAVVDVIRPSIAIAKTPDLQQVVSGGTVTFTIRVTNTGDVTLNPVAVSDPLASACNRANVGPLTAGQSTSYTCSVSNVTADFTNVATATGTPPVGPPVTDDDNAVVDVIRPSIAIAKTPDLQQVVSGGTVTFTIRVTNTGDVTLNPVAVSDPLAPACNRANVGPLTAGQSTSYTCSVSNVTADFTNVATATGTPPVGPPVTDDDNAVVDVFTTGLDIQKTLLTQQQVRPGQPVSFRITVTNTGNVAITKLPLLDTYNWIYLTYLSATPASDDNVSDGQINWADLVVSFGANLAPGQSYSVTVNFTARADTTLLPGGVTLNVATVSGAIAGGTTLPDASSTAPVSIQAPTGILLGSVSADVAGDQVALSWNTLSEANIAGFNIWRRTIDGVAVQLNTTLISAQKSGTSAGATYSFGDAVDAGQVYEYSLEVIGLNGATSQHPLGVVATGKRVYLPLIGR